MKIGGNRTLVDLFIENVNCVPDAPFVRFADIELSYAEMGQASEQMADNPAARRVSSPPCQW